jgi:hypothetical protein
MIAAAITATSATTVTAAAAATTATAFTAAGVGTAESRRRWCFKMRALTRSTSTVAAARLGGTGFFKTMVTDVVASPPLLLIMMLHVEHSHQMGRC